MPCHNLALCASSSNLSLLPPPPPPARPFASHLQLNTLHAHVTSEYLQPFVARLVVLQCLVHDVVLPTVASNPIPTTAVPTSDSEPPAAAGLNAAGMCGVLLSLSLLSLSLLSLSLSLSLSLLSLLSLLLPAPWHVLQAISFLSFLVGEWW